jgi:hypothetical protein
LNDEEATPPSGAAPAGRPRRALDLDEDPDDDLPIGRLRAGSGATTSGGATFYEYMYSSTFKRLSIYTRVLLLVLYYIFANVQYN